MIEFRVLGPVEVLVDGCPQSISSTQTRTMLAILLLRAGRPVPVEELIDRLWDGKRLPVDPRATIHTYVGRLRAVVGAETVQRKAPGYLICVGPADLAEFRRLTRLAATVPDRRVAVRYLTEALEQWRGDPLTGAACEAEAAGLAEERLHATEQLLQARLDLGEGVGLLGQLGELTREHPHRERFWAQRILALYRHGRQVDALSAYSELRRYLAVEFGIEPSGELQELHRIVLNSEDASEAGPGGGGAWLVRSQLPLAPAGLVGRSEVLGAVCERVRSGSSSVIAISGLPGVGKSALALAAGHAVADRFPDGQWFLSLGGADSADQVLAEVLRLSGLHPSALPDGRAARMAMFRERLAGRRVLILADDAQAVDQVRVLLPGDRGNAVLVTSRNDLAGLAAVDGAHHIVLPVLTVDAALELVAKGLTDTSVRLEPEPARELVRLCSGLPLALRIAVAKVAARPDWTLAEHVVDLRSGDRLGNLTVPGDPGAAVDRALARSMQALPADLRECLGLLSLIPGESFALPAVVALLGTEVQRAQQTLSALVGANLVQRRTPVRYVLHDLVRLSAQAHCGATAEGRLAALTRLYDWYFAHVVEATSFDFPVLTGLEPPPVQLRLFKDGDEAREWLEAELANLVALIGAAEASGVRDQAWRLTDVLRHYLLQSGLTKDWETAARAGLRAAVVARDEVAQGLMLQSLANLADVRGEFTAAIELAGRALPLFVASGFARGEASVLNNLGISYLGLGEASKAQEVLDRSIALFRCDGNSRLTTLAMTNLAAAKRWLGDLTGSIAVSTEGLELDHSLARPVGLVAKLVIRADTYRLVGEPDLALADLTAALEISSSTAPGFHRTSAYAGLADLSLDGGQVDAARKYTERVLSSAEENGDRWHLAIGGRLTGDIAMLLGRGDEAAAGYQQSLDIASAGGYRQLAAEADLCLATVAMLNGQLPAARDTALDVLERARSLSLAIIEAQTQLVLSDITFMLGSPDTEQHRASARALMNRTGFRPATHHDVDHLRPVSPHGVPLNCDHLAPR